MIWFFEFRDSINDWNFRYCKEIWKVEKNWNGMEWFGGLETLKKLKKYNEMKWVK